MHVHAGDRQAVLLRQAKHLVQVLVPDAVLAVGAAGVGLFRVAVALPGVDAFNLANLVILPLILGIGVVNGIHIIHRYREAADKSANILSLSTGQAVVLSSLTTMIGFGAMMAARHQGIFSLGLVLTLGVFCCLAASVTTLPAMLKLCSQKGWRV